jgi:hypothetical protein
MLGSIKSRNMLCARHECQNNVVGKAQGRRQPGMPKQRWEDNVRDSLEGGCGMDLYYIR